MHAFIALQVTLDQLDLVEGIGEVLTTAGGEVVEHPHGVAVAQQAIDEVRADEPSAPRDQDLSGPIRHRAEAYLWRWTLQHQPHRNESASDEELFGKGSPRAFEALQRELRDELSSLPGQGLAVLEGALHRFGKAIEGAADHLLAPREQLVHPA